MLMAAVCWIGIGQCNVMDLNILNNDFLYSKRVEFSSLSYYCRTLQRAEFNWADLAGQLEWIELGCVVFLYFTMMLRTAQGARISDNNQVKIL